jgi:hypothetical protein
MLMGFVIGAAAVAPVKATAQEIGEFPLAGTDARGIAGGVDLERSTEFLLQVGPLGRALRGVDGAVRARVSDAVRDAVAPFLTPEGVQMPSAAWIVSARCP